MVSSKCCQVESPSPFRFLAALMPPCAHTECDRLTGTIEKRSTLAPISAILMTAESPARPPPMTIIFGAGIVPLSAFFCLICLLFVTAVLGSVDCCGRERKEVRLANPAPVKTKKSARHTTKNRFRAFSPDTMPHFAQNSQIPYAKCHEAAIKPAT